ncbi:ABC-2 family transporter protein [Micromonospora sp. NPDC047074]|uniref:ABC transporter permease n=1 Tax=Micromonospora sp. NPDC047074 TaxID=3154339 RepID=UPI0033EA1930
MRPYVSLARTAWSSLLAYRGEFLLLVLTGGVVQTVGLLAVWRAVYAGSGEDLIGGLTWDQMRGYLLVALLTGTLLGGFTDVALAGRVLSGTVALDLVRPVDYQLARFAEAIGYLLAELLTSAVMIGVLVLVFGGVALPEGTQAVLWLLSLLAVVPLKFALVYTVGLACFWTQNFQGLSMARMAITNIGSGSVAPIALYPEWLQTLCWYSPFPSVVSTPALIFLGKAQGAEAWSLIGTQLIWIVLLWGAARLLWPLSVRKLTVHGG